MVTAPFAPKARREAESFGVGDLPIVVVPHADPRGIPIGHMSADAIQAIAERSVAEIRFALTAPACEVAEAYRDLAGPLAASTARP